MPAIPFTGQYFRLVIEAMAPVYLPPRTKDLEMDIINVVEDAWVERITFAIYISIEEKYSLEKVHCLLKEILCQ